MTQSSDTIARRNVLVLVAAQAVLGAQMPMFFIVGGLAGRQLAPNPCLATLPITMMVVGSMLSANPLSAVMARWGRRAGFVIGTIGGTLGASLAAYALSVASFPLFLLGALFSGVYQSSQGFFRFAATDTASAEFRPKAISWVLAGGLVSALTGPELVKLTTGALAVPFLGTYLAAIALNLVGVWLFALLKIPRPEVRSGPIGGRSRRELLSDPRILVAVIVATVSYALMNLIMTSSPLAIVGCGYHTSDAANVVAAHVWGMFLPSFFTGTLIARFGVERIMALGLVILASAGMVAIAGVQLENFFLALILLGIGWNFGFIGATTMLTNSHTAEERGRMQGLNDFIVFGGVTLASLSSGGLMNCTSHEAGLSTAEAAREGWNAVNMATVPFLVLAGGALIWLWLRPKPREAGL